MISFEEEDVFSEMPSASTEDELIEMLLFPPSSFASPLFSITAVEFVLFDSLSDEEIFF